MIETMTDAPPWRVTLADEDLPLRDGSGRSIRGVVLRGRPETPPSVDADAVAALQRDLDEAREQFLASSPVVAEASRLLATYRQLLAEADAARQDVPRLKAEAEAALAKGGDYMLLEQTAAEAEAKAVQLDTRATRVADLLEAAQVRAQKDLSRHLAGIHREHEHAAAAKHEAVAAKLKDDVARQLAEAGDLAATRYALNGVKLDDELPDAIDFHARRLEAARADLHRGLGEFRRLPYALRKVARAAVGTARAGVPAEGDEAAVLAGIPSLVRLIRGPVPVRDVLRESSVSDLAGRDQDLAEVLIDLRR